MQLGLPSNSQKSRGASMTHEEDQILLIEDNMIQTTGGQTNKRTDDEGLPSPRKVQLK